MEKRDIAGFSLVELSIVLVILGLLVGGILGGQSLIKAAELRKITTELTAYQTATNAFRLKYIQLPGDFNKAQSFWTPATACSGMSAAMTAGTFNGTCNGNGNGAILQYGSGAAIIYEAYLYWQHLSLAGLIPNQIDLNLDMTSSSFGGRYATVLPQSSSGGYWLVYQNTTDLYGNKGRTHFRLYSLASAANQPSMTPIDTWTIDSKIDDGKPATGNMLVTFGGTCSLKPDGTTSTGTDYDAEYNLALDTVVCVPAFDIL